MTVAVSSQLRVLVAGGGVAGLETLLALRDLAGDRVERTLLTPEQEFVYRPDGGRRAVLARARAASPARRDRRRPRARAWSAARSPRSRTAPARRSPSTGERLSYDALVVAVGAGSEPAFTRALTWTPESDAEVYGGLLRDIEEGYSKRVAFVIPLGVAWPLPAYELALMTAWEARGMGMDDVQITIYTPESAPLEIFGAAATGALREDLDAVGIEVETERVT